MFVVVIVHGDFEEKLVVKLIFVMKIPVQAQLSVTVYTMDLNVSLFGLTEIYIR